MNTNKKLLFLFFLLLFCGCNSSNEEIFNVATIDTNFGKIEFVLTNETPIHRDNFIKLAKDDFYEDILFHRVVKDFVIQAGDPLSIGLPLGEDLPDSDDVAPTIPAEIIPSFHNIKGAVGMARTGDDVNPKRNSSATQFYIILGGNERELDPVEVNESCGDKKYLEETYLKEGGAPHLDGNYTLFGFVIDGMKVAENMAKQPTGGNHNRPIQNIFIKSVKIKEVKKSEIEDLDIFKLFYADTERANQQEIKTEE